VLCAILKDQFGVVLAEDSAASSKARQNEPSAGLAGGFGSGNGGASGDASASAGVHLYRMVVPQGTPQHRQVCICIEGGICTKGAHLYRMVVPQGTTQHRQVCICIEWCAFV